MKNPLKKVMRIGTTNHDSAGRWVSIYFCLELRAGRNGYYSFTGVINPRHSGNADCCGQIDMEFLHRNPKHDDERYAGFLIKPEQIRFRPGWDARKLLRYLDIWRRYHMKAHLPPTVQAFLEALPETDKEPAWA